MCCSDVREPCCNHYYKVTESQYECSHSKRQDIKTQPSTKVMKHTVSTPVYTLFNDSSVRFWSCSASLCFAESQDNLCHLNFLTDLLQTSFSVAITKCICSDTSKSRSRSPIFTVTRKGSLSQHALDERQSTARAGRKLNTGLIKSHSPSTRQNSISSLPKVYVFILYMNLFYSGFTQKYVF